MKAKFYSVILSAKVSQGRCSSSKSDENETANREDNHK